MKSDLISVGQPGAFSDWVNKFFAETLAAAYGHGLAESRWLGPEDHVDDLGIGGERLRLIAMTNTPSPTLLQRALTRRTPVLVLLEDCVDSYGFVKRAWGASPADSIRAVLDFASACMPLRGYSHVTFLERSNEARARSYTRWLLEWLDLNLPEADRIRLIDKFSGAADENLSLAQSLATHVEKAVRVDIDPISSALPSAFAPIVRMVKGGAYEPIPWVSALFLDDKLTPATSEGCDLVGPPRTIFRGPYVRVPPGVYEIALSADFNEETVGTLFALEIYWGVGEEKLCCGRVIKPESSGRQQGKFRADLSGSVAPLDVKISLGQPMLGGRFKLERLEFNPVELA